MPQMTNSIDHNKKREQTFQSKIVLYFEGLVTGNRRKGFSKMMSIVASLINMVGCMVLNRCWVMLLLQPFEQALFDDSGLATVQIR